MGRIFICILNQKEDYMSKSFVKQFIAFVLTIAISVTLLENASIVNASESLTDTSQIVYVDGNAIRVTTNVESGIITAESVDKSDYSVLEISEYSDNIVTIYDESECAYVDYCLDIEDLSTEDIDITVKDQDGEIVESYENVDDLLEDSYEGQVAITVVAGITVSALITAILTAAACIAVSGVIYYGAKAAVKAIEKSAEQKKYYYKAYIYEKNVFINLNQISTESAKTRIRTGQSIYSYTASLAKSAVTSTGLGCSSSDISCLSGKIRFYHYHTSPRNGSHSFYGAAITY